MLLLNLFFIVREPVDLFLLYDSSQLQSKVKYYSLDVNLNHTSIKKEGYDGVKKVCSNFFSNLVDFLS